MKTLWNRFKYTVEAELHELFDKKEAKNPIAMLNQYIREAEKETASVGKLLERQSQLKEALEKEQQEATTMLEKRRTQLALAEQTEETDLINFATSEVQAYDQRLQQITAEIHITIKELMALEQKFEQMKHQVKDMKVRQLSLMGKENVLRANARMDQIIQQEKQDQATVNMDEINSYMNGLGRKIEDEYERSTLERRLYALENTEKNAQIV